MKNICPACLSNNISKLHIELPYLRHLDFTTVSKNGNLIKCSECQTITNPNAVKTEAPTFESKRYAYSHQTQQTMSVDEYTEPVTRSFLQAKILRDKIINNEQTRILDIGCFNGRLLRELDGVLSNADLWGFDINPHLETLFFDKENFNFISTGLEDVDGHMDLIILSHSIQYIPDLPEIVTSIDRLLNNNGYLFIQIPDISKNPFYSLMGDQCFIFTETSLINVLVHFGYKAEIITNNYFPREILVVAQKDESAGSNNYEEDNIFAQNIQAIDHTKDKLQNISHQNLTVLGTTVNAAFVDEIIGERIQFFVDENVSMSGKMFRGKKVLYPKNLNTKNHIILPYWDSGNKIKERFEKEYKGTFTVI